MALPDAKILVLDGALGLAEGATTQVHAKVGVCSLGTPLAIATYTDASALRANLGTGPLVEAAALALTVSQQPVIVVPVNPSVAGVASAVTASKTGTGNMTVGGAPRDAYKVKVVILAAGVDLAARTATFHVSLDNGVTFGVEIAMPLAGVYALPDTGLTLTFTNGAPATTSFAVGDTYSFTCTAPGFAAPDLAAALDALIADTTRTWFGVHVVGAYSSVALAAGMMAAVDAKLEAAALAYRFVWGMIEVPPDTATATVDAFASTYSKRVTGAVGTAQMTSVISGQEFTRSSAWAISAWAAAHKPHKNLAEVALGALPYVKTTSLSNADLNALNNGGFAALRTHIGLAGVYVAEARVRAAPGSDFQYIHLRRIMDIGSAALRDAMLYFLGKDLDVDSVTGFITEPQANALRNEALARYIRPALFFGKPDEAMVAGVSLVIPTNVNIISGETLEPELRLTPKGYLRDIVARIGFKNPAIQA